MPPPPPPPPPGSGPGLPPPPNLSKSAGALPNRQGLLTDITKGKQLKKTTTNDRSAPIVGGGVVASGDKATSMGRPPSIPKSVPESSQGASIGDSTGSAPQLGGLFAGGMPTLRKTNIPISRTGQDDLSNSPSVPSSRLTSVPSGPNNSGPPRPPPSTPKARPQPTTKTASHAPGLPPMPPPPIPVSSGSAPSQAAPPRSNNSTNAPSDLNVPPSRPAQAPPSLPLAPPPSLPQSRPPPLPGTAPPLPSAAPPSPTPVLSSYPPRNAPSLPAPAPPPPPPPPSGLTLKPADMPTRGSVPQVHSALHTRDASRDSQYDSQSTGHNVASHALGDHDTDLNGLQAALASRNSSRPTPESSSFLAPAQNGSNGADYSLRPQHVKRIDDSKYRFQPDSALPPIRPHTNCLKAYRSGRPGGTTVPLDLSIL